MFSRRQFVATLGLLPFAARAQGIDTARIIIGFPPGGTTDVMGRKVAEKLRGSYARSVIVDNRPGAGGQIGVTALKDNPSETPGWETRLPTRNCCNWTARCWCLLLSRSRSPHKMLIASAVAS